MSLEIKENKVVYKLGQEYIISKIIDFNYVFAKNTTTLNIERLAIKDLSSKPIEQKNTVIYDDLSSIPQKKLEEAKCRYEAISPVIGLNSRKAIELRAKELKISPTTLYNWIRAYETSGQLSSLASLKVKGGKGKSRLSLEQDEIIDLVLKEYYLTKLKPTVQRAYELVVSKCKQANINPPSRSSMMRRANVLSETRLLKKREGKKAIEKFEFNQGEYPDGLYPLHVLQIDHTKADIILVDDEYRQELGRPWITMAIDVYSRMVAGFYISFESPGYFATGQTLYNAMLPKDRLREKYQFESDWPLWGIPNMIHMDNAKEFRGIDLQYVCDEYGINIVWRPVGKARFGAHIERLLGSLSNYIHTLEGTTFSNISNKREYNPQQHANMTLNEFEKWLTVLIADVYHKKIHSQLNMTPLKMYENGIFGTINQPPRGLPPRIEDEQFLYVNLLPKEERTIQKYGVQIDGIYYYSEVLNVWIDSYEIIRGHKIKRKFLIRRDPRDISNIWFFDPNAKTYYMIPYRNTRLPKVSIWEYRAAQKYLKSIQNRDYKEDEVFDALDKLRRMAFESKDKTKSHRKIIDRISKLQQIESKRPDTKTQQDSVKSYNSQDTWLELGDITPFDGIDDISKNVKKQNDQSSVFIISDDNDSDTIL